MSSLAPRLDEVARPEAADVRPALQIVPVPAAVPTRHGYQPPRRSAPALAASLAIVGGLGSVLMLIGGPMVIRQKPKPLVVTMTLLPPPPPPVEPVAETPPPPPAAVVVAPPPIVKTPVPPIMATVPPEQAPAPDLPPAPPAPVVAAASAAPPAPAAPAASVESGDLSVNMIDADPPRYPTDSRRRREQGVVRLSVLVGTDGRVADIGIAGSSGSDRLDKAALAAVKRWRWSPLKRAGLAVMVRGVVTIPFVLKG